MSEKLLDIRDLRTWFKTDDGMVRAVDGVSMSIDAGETLTGLAKLFGGSPGRLNSFGAGFDEETYQKAKPHFKAALAAFQAAGKTLKDLFKLLITQFGDGIKEYAIRFAKDEGLAAQLAPASKEPGNAAAPELDQPSPGPLDGAPAADVRPPAGERGTGAGERLRHRRPARKCRC